MVIYGVALLAGCMMAGLVIGDLLGEMLSIDSNLGGVGIAMLLLIFITGVLFAWLYWRTGSLWASVGAHAGQNALAVGVHALGG